jgi:integrase
LKSTLQIPCFDRFPAQPTITVVSQADILASIIRQEAESMRFQDPEIEKHGSFWRVRAYVPRLDGKGGVERIRKSFILGRNTGPGALTSGQAKMAKQRLMSTINQGAMVIASQIPFGVLLDQYKLTGMGPLKTSTVAKYMSFIGKHIEPSFRSMTLAEIDRGTVQMWVSGLVKDGLEPSTVESLRNCLSAIFTFAEDVKLWDGRNPCERVTVPKRPRDRKPRREKRLITLEELQRFLASIEDTAICKAVDARLIVRLACTTTLRVGEVLGLQYGDLKNDMAHVQRRVYRGDIDEPKSEASKRWVLIGTLAQELGKGPANAFIFRRLQEPLDDRDLQQHVFRPAAERAGIYYPGFGMHAFRRAAITWRQSIGGAGPLEAMKAAGHTRADMTMLYTLGDAERERAQVAAVQAAIAGGGKKGRLQ